MTIQDNFSINRLFISKTITLQIGPTSFSIHMPTIAQSFNDAELNLSHHLWLAPIDEIKSLYMLPLKSSYDIVTIMLFKLGAYDRYREVYHAFIHTLKILCPEIVIDNAEHQLRINDLIINEEIWDYILYILKLSNGEKVEKPMTFDSEEARQFYLAQKANEEKIAKLRQKNASQSDSGLAKILLSINYAFPGLTIDYLINQTMAQIQWLQKYAAGSVSYEVNAKAFAAGNMKKGSRLDFFIK